MVESSMNTECAVTNMVELWRVLPKFLFVTVLESNTD